MYLIGIDVGGTKLEAVLLVKKDSKYKTLSQLRCPTQRDLGYDHIVESISNLITDVCVEAEVKLEKVKSVGLSMPGSIDPATNIMHMGNTRVLEHKNIHKDLKKELGSILSFTFENDANCFALAEVLLGAGMKHQIQKNKPIDQHYAVGIILGTGCGAGIILNGKTFKGARGGAGEFGHTELHENGRPCYCDRKGCAEQYLCGPSLVERFKEASGEKLTTKEIFASDAPEAKVLIETYKKDLAKFIGIITNSIDPDYIVLGGGVSKQDILYEGLEKEIKKNLFIRTNPPKIYQHQISDSAGSFGAALLGR